MRYLILLALAGCTRGPMFDTPYRDFATVDYAPTFEIDDPSDGLFPNKSSRVGERAYAWRGRIGVRRKFDSGAELYLRAGPENRHVGAIEIGAEIPIGGSGPRR